MDANQIQLEIKNRGFNMSDFARALKISRMTVCGVVHGRTKSRRVADAIAIVLDKTLDELWPGAYPESYAECRRMTANEKLGLIVAKIDGAHSQSAAA